MRVKRLGDGPIIGPDTHPSIGTNIQGPSMIRVPDWVPAPLGRYYLYFADHKGSYIRLAYADAVGGPWTVHPPGSLHLADSCFLTETLEATPDELEFLRAAYEEVLGTADLPHDFATEATTPHIASPDVHVDAEGREIVMYFHGLEDLGYQVTRRAVSADGLTFRAEPEILGMPYMRAFARDGWTYAITMPGRVSRSRDGRGGFEAGPTLFDRDMRHAAVRVVGDRLDVFWTRVGDAPERILLSSVDMAGDWTAWVASEPVEVLRPEKPWEGADAPLEPSRRSTAYGHVNQLRDPAVFEDEGRTYLLYAVAGESGIALAELSED